MEWDYKDYLINIEKWLFSKEIKTDNIKVTNREYQWNYKPFIREEIHWDREKNNKKGDKKREWERRREEKER